jgi:hypothetical protein
MTSLRRGMTSFSVLFPKDRGCLLPTSSKRRAREMNLRYATARIHQEGDNFYATVRLVDRKGQHSQLYFREVAPYLTLLHDLIVRGIRDEYIHRKGMENHYRLGHRQQRVA